MFKLSFIFLLSLILWQCPGQQGGLLVSDERYQLVPVLPVYSGVKYTEIPLKVSLKKYCPVPGDQRQTGACAGWAAGYGALTIHRAIQNGLTDQAIITQNANSAAFIYNQVKRQKIDCREGAYLEDALEILRNQGDCLEQSFAFEKVDCHTQPGTIQRVEAQQFRIQDFAAVFTLDEAGKSKTGKVCKILATQTPILIGMGVTASFFDILPGATNWNPSTQEEITGYHAMVLTGYNNVDRHFECFNSFGASWGQNGFIRIPYDDFERLCRYAFVMVPGTDYPVARTNIDNTAASTITDEHRFLSGTFVFRRPAGFVTNEAGDELVYFEEINTHLQREGTGIYHTKENIFRIGDGFQLVAREIPAGRYAFVFSQDATGETNIHFPKKRVTGATAGFVLDKTVEIVIPDEEHLLQLAAAGSDFLCILYANAPIPDFDKRIQRLQSDQAPLPEKFASIFADILITAPNVQFAPDKMSFHAIADPPGGHTAVAIILEVVANP
jgi:Papain family cysteine protease